MPSHLPLTSMLCQLFSSGLYRNIMENFWHFFINGLVMRNFFTSIDFLSEKKKHEMQIKFYNDLKQGLALEPTERMYREVKELALQGRNVVVESPLHLWEGVDLVSCLTQLDGVNVIYVLAYCPWNDLINRIKQRNSSKNKKIHRELDWALINFVHCYEVCPEYRSNNFLECMNGKNAQETIAEYSQPQYKKKRLHLLAETQQAVLQSFSQPTNYYIYPRFDYNITVNTKMHSPEQGAAVVLDSIGSKNHVLQDYKL